MVKNGERWTYDEFMKCWTLYNEGLSIREISVEIDRTLGATKYKMSQHGLYYHPPAGGI